MKRGTKRFIHIVISIIYIAWGIGAPLSALEAVLSLNISALLSAAVGIVMLLAGIFGLFRIKPLKRRILGVVIFLLSALSVVTSLKAGITGISWQAVIQAILAWLYIIF